jgi:hypothetical protein
VTGPDGRFRLDKLRPGDYQLRAEAVGYVSGRFPVTVAPGQQTDITIALAAGYHPAQRGGRGDGAALRDRTCSTARKP